MLNAAAAFAGRPSDEPPVIKQRNELTGKMDRIQTFDGGLLEFTPDKMTMAQAYYFFGNGEPPEPENLEATCVLQPDGTILDYTCSSHRGIGGIPPLLSAARRAQVFSAACRFPPRASGKQSVVRRVRFDFRASPFPMPKFDLASGKLVAPSLLKGFRPDGTEAYPMRALREEAEGVEDFECQVQADLSVICHPVRFDPPDNAIFFENAERALFFRVKVEAQLSNGQSAVGVRFRHRIRWTIPKDSGEASQ